MNKISRIILYYDDGKIIQIERYQIEAVEALVDTVDLLQKAEQVYRQLEPLFVKKEAKSLK